MDELPDTAAAAAAAQAAPRVPFWLQPPPEEAPAAAWQNFAGRTHMVGIAQAWRSGLRFILGEPGIPSAGISKADLDASRCAPPPPLLQPRAWSPKLKGWIRSLTSTEACQLQMWTALHSCC